MKKVLVALMLGMGLLALGAGCSKEEAKSDAKADTKAADSKSSGDSIGIAECDEYIKKYSACIDKMPEAARAPAKQGFETAKTGWKASAAASKDTTKASCKAALDALASNPVCK
jgi:hypothetical protein